MHMASPSLVTTAVLLLLCWSIHQTKAQGLLGWCLWYIHVLLWYIILIPSMEFCTGSDNVYYGHSSNIMFCSNLHPVGSYKAKLVWFSLLTLY